MVEHDKKKLGKIMVTVSDKMVDNAYIQNAKITIIGKPEEVHQDSESPCPQPAAAEPIVGYSGADGRIQIEGVPPGDYDICCEAFGEHHKPLKIQPNRMKNVEFRIHIDLKVDAKIVHPDGGIHDSMEVTTGTPLVLAADYSEKIGEVSHTWHPSSILLEHGERQNALQVHAITNVPPGLLEYGVTLHDPQGAQITASNALTVLPRAAQPIDGNVGVILRRSETRQTQDQALWVAIRNRTKAIAFSGSGYKSFIDRVLCQRKRENPPSRALGRKLDALGDHVYGTQAYDLLKTATEVFLLLECGVAINRTGVHDDDPIYDPLEEGARLGLDRGIALGEIRDRLTDYLGQGRLPYINRILETAFGGEQPTDRVHCHGVLSSRIEHPCLLELIWSYWHEEGMLVQTLNAISRRFQNIRRPGGKDPLAHLEIDPLHSMNNLLWGYVQDERKRLGVKRRAYEYDHEYGLPLYGKAVPVLRSADRRSKFLEGFHNLLHRCSLFFSEDNDTTVIADGYPLLNALKEVHLILAQGAHNQFGDLPWMARVEMLVQQWLLARPEMRDFLQSRAMVPYKEAWMPQVDTMKTLQGWSDVTVTHFRDLAVDGEPLLLSIRYDNWNDKSNEDSAKNWARYWRPEIQSYLHAYRAVTGVDLTNPETVDYTFPAAHLRKRLALQQRAR